MANSKGTRELTTGERRLREGRSRYSTSLRKSTVVMPAGFTMLAVPCNVIPTNATGTPADIAVIDSSESTPATPPPRSGTPMTGIVTWEATMPARLALTPPPAMTTSTPRGSSVAHQSNNARGDRCGLMTVSS